MGIQTLIVIPRHLEIEEVARSLASTFGSSDFKVLPRYNTNHKLIELIDDDSRVWAIDVFLNSYAADDYADIYRGESTLIALPYEPSAIAAIERYAEVEQAFVRRHDGAGWLSGTA